MATVTQGAKVGAFLLISAAGGFLVYNTVKKEVGRGTGYTVHAYLNDASGLAPHSRVTIAGIPVGQIQKIYLEGGRARVDVHVGSDVELNATATLGVRSASLLGENVIGWGSHFFCKMPQDGKQVAWHQDASYWPLSPSKAVTCWLAVDDADVENACMRFVSGSHHHGAMTFRPSDPAEHNVLNQTIENVEQYGQFVDDCLKAGEISLHSDLLLHGSEANMSDRRRCGLTLRYAPVDVHAYMDWNQKGVWVSGSDATGHWANRARPTDE